ncbi:hypothetical protein NE237_016806 [Protea cynaroides]|uniref:RRM domain-containing protein n=1 Tax=Protea cynaroides TaxID=273540 RepID=A0A9Q0HEI6_9MAGN|nr:hypothetical protein NE237_016806 [Protea cynaroides]
MLGNDRWLGNLRMLNQGSRLGFGMACCLGLIIGDGDMARWLGRQVVRYVMEMVGQVWSYAKRMMRREYEEVSAACGGVPVNLGSWQWFASVLQQIGRMVMARCLAGIDGHSLGPLGDNGGGGNSRRVFEGVLHFSCLFMGTPKEVYRAFMEKVKRTVFLDNLSPEVTAAVIKTALGQFGNVINVQFIPNYTGPRNIPKCALVELETAKQAQGIIQEMTNFPFMMSGMPRPVRASAAELEMFADHPKKPGLETRCHWVEPTDPDFEVVTELKDLVKKHALEASLLLKLELEEEEKVSKHQVEVLQSNYQKFEMIDNVVADKTLIHLASQYGMRMKDD